MDEPSLCDWTAEFKMGSAHRPDGDAPIEHHPAIVWWPASALPARSSRRTLSSDLFLAPAFGGPARPPHLMDPMEMANYQVSVW